MNHYGGTVTVAGRNLITSLMAGDTIEFTRIVVGNGVLPEDVEPIDVTDLVNPVALGTATVPRVENNVMYMTVEFRNDMNGGLTEGFWLHEFGVFAKTANTEEVLLYYATLGDSPQPVNAYKDNRIDIRRYPISIALEIDADINVLYNADAFITSEEAYRLILDLFGDIVKGFETSVIAEITIPVSSWTASSDSTYAYVSEVSVDKCKESYFPNVALHKEYLKTALDAGFCNTVQSLDGKLRFWSEEKPADNIKATAVLIKGSLEADIEDDSDSSVIIGGGTGNCDCEHEYATTEDVDNLPLFDDEEVPNGYEMATTADIDSLPIFN